MGVKVREKPEGSGIWWLFIDHQGRRKAKKVGRDNKFAIEAARKIEAKLVFGDFQFEEPGQDEMPTLQQYLRGYIREGGASDPGWFVRYAKLSLKRSTWTVYDTLLNAHILSEIGSCRLDQITPRMVNDFIVKKFSQGLRCQTVKNLKHCLSSIMQHAYQPDGHIEKNPVRGVKVPRPADEQASREPDPFSWEDRTVLEEIFRKRYPGYYAVVIMGFRTGLRLGELLALQWGDIDFRHKLIRVSRNIAAGRITTAKSRSSVRDVRMTSQLIQELKTLQVRRKEDTLREGWAEVPEWVFCSEKGGPLDAGNFRKRVWDKAIKDSELRRRTPHDMRHTYVTLRLSKGDSLAEVSKEMGHGSAEVTYKTYYKWLPKESRTDIDELDNTQADATQTQLDSRWKI
jgi:integrase